VIKKDWKTLSKENMYHVQSATSMILENLEKWFGEGGGSTARRLNRKRR